MSTLTNLPAEIHPGTPSGPITLSMTSLISEMSITDPYFSNTANWSKVVFNYTDATGSESTLLRFYIPTVPGIITAILSVSSHARENTWTCTSIAIFDFDNGVYVIPRSSFPTPAEFDVPVTPPPPLYSYYGYLTELSPNSSMNMYSINAGTGALSALSPSSITGTSNNFDLVTHPSGKWAYLGCQSGSPAGAVRHYSIDQTTGVLTFQNAVTAGGSLVGAVSITPNGLYLYAIDGGAGPSNTIFEYSINQTNGDLTPIGTNSVAGRYSDESVVDPLGRFYYSSTTATGHNIFPFTIDAITGVLTAVTPPVVANTYIEALMIDPAGKFLYASLNADYSMTAFAINQSTGAITVSGNYPVGQDYIRGSAMTPDGKFMYLGGDTAIYMYAVNATTGALSNLSPVSIAIIGSTVEGISIDPTGTYLYAVNYVNTEVYSINATTGQLTRLFYYPVSAGQHLAIAKVTT